MDIRSLDGLQFCSPCNLEVLHGFGLREEGSAAIPFSAPFEDKRVPEASGWSIFFRLPSTWPTSVSASKPTVALCLRPLYQTEGMGGDLGQ